MRALGVMLLALVAVLVASTPALAGDGDEIKVEGVLGEVDAAAAQRVLQPQFPAFARCFTDEVGAMRYVGGRAELRFRIKKDGALRWVQLGGGDLGSWPVERCLRRAAAALRFEAPRGGEAELRFPIELPASAPAIPTEEVVDKKQMATLKACGRTPGEVTVTLYVAAGGQVTSAGFATEGPNLLTEKWGDCAHAKATSWRLRDPRGQVLKAQRVWKK